MLAIGASFLLGCSSSQSTNAPAAYQPEGSPEPLPKDQRPASIVIDPNNRDAFVQTTIDPVIYDTRTVTPQIQIAEPHDGPISMIKHQLYQHSRDKTLEDIPDNARTLPVGQAVEMDRVNHAGGTGYRQMRKARQF